MRAWTVRSAWLLGLLATTVGARAAVAEPTSPAEEIEECLGCHGDESVSVKLENGEEASLFMSKDLLAGSVHKSLRCTSCHVGMNEVPHPERHFANLAKFRASFGEVCKTCHAENYAKLSDSVHHLVDEHGDGKGPTCVTCHGSHGVAQPAKPRSRISQTCATCHLAVFEAYAKSVHGKALLGQENPDVPVCTDCHHSHDIADPRKRAWLLATPDLCGKCHADAKRMAKYGLSTSVLSTYLADFHGTTASFGRHGKDMSAEPVVALCVDCHGIHNIVKVTGDEAAGFRGNLVQTCRKCHPGASQNFPAAWLFHYEPTLAHAPVVWGIKLFYKLLIPFIVGGLILQVSLHLWWARRNR